MIDVIKVASYICKRYQDEMGTSIDEMKLHKLLYFTQREAIIQTGEPMFSEQFVAWKYGPVMLVIRDRYKVNNLNEMPSKECISKYEGVFNTVFTEYAGRDSWNLSMLSHGESSWINARQGLEAEVNGHNMMDINDIRRDAERIKMRRFYFSEILPQINANN